MSRLGAGRVPSTDQLIYALVHTAKRKGGLGLGPADKEGRFARVHPVGHGGDRRINDDDAFRGGDVGHACAHNLGVDHVVFTVAAGNRSRNYMPEFVDLAPLDESFIHRAAQVPGLDGRLFG